MVRGPDRLKPRKRPLPTGSILPFSNSYRRELKRRKGFLEPIEGSGQMAEEKEASKDELAESLMDLFTNISTMVKGELEGTNNQLLLLEKMNKKVAEEYSGYGDVASGLRVFVEQLSKKNHGFEEYVQQIEKIDQQVTEFEAVISMLDKYVSLLEKKVQSACPNMPT
ncbi:hypothetical protein Cni_G08528 [Canna indica]|uniref:Biogenesis of lysosome-related organelles complex 1 subunit 2 n=1 Tax=Canna indica TaxID=4628 RepID=A0AAQ3K138_9LILI|nr:hypothetical protein Cni_G08528 [Canna indica]